MSKFQNDVVICSDNLSCTRKTLQNEYLLATIGFDKAENEPLKAPKKRISLNGADGAEQGEHASKASGAGGRGCFGRWSPDFKDT